LFTTNGFSGLEKQNDPCGVARGGVCAFPVADKAGL
jgi:hypothetical protein